ncbi:hypothetical protein GCM10008965_10580 [Methylorubrum aminovorans]|nr:hypothetical protein GCM10025880_61080 [Methylorubrum aminovorans]
MVLIKPMGSDRLFRFVVAGFRRRLGQTVRERRLSTPDLSVEATEGMASLKRGHPA